MFLDLQEILRFLTQLSQYGACFLALPPSILLFMQYVILRVALHEVLIVVALGLVEVNVKSFVKKNQKKIKTIFKIIF